MMIQFTTTTTKIYNYIFPCRPPTTMYQRRCLMPLTYISSRNLNCKDAYSQCNLNNTLYFPRANFFTTLIYYCRNVLGYKIVGYPVRIEHQRYTRNAFYFNLCFVCDSWARTVQYEPIVRKLSEYFVS